MGILIFLWDFLRFTLIISPVRCEQVISKVVFDYGELDLQCGGNGFSFSLYWI